MNRKNPRSLRVLLVLAILTLSLSLLLSGCNKGHPQPEGSGTPDAQSTEPGSLTNLPANSTQDPRPESSDTGGTGEGDGEDINPYYKPLTEEQLVQQEKQWFFRMALNDFENIYAAMNTPTFYPVDEQNLNALREFLLECNETFVEYHFDAYSPELCEWGYKVKIDYPCDYWGNNFYIWFEVDHDDTSYPLITIVSPGEDGKLSYKGSGADYTSGGFGDDDVRFLRYN